jgi:pimeloyl-ACP methyl ester carboxylesterase
MATIEILGVPHAYELTAPTSCPSTLVFIHGWLNSRGYWQPVIERLSGNFQCLSYDLRGFGESQCNTDHKFHQNQTSLKAVRAVNTMVVGEACPEGLDPTKAIAPRVSSRALDNPYSERKTFPQGVEMIKANARDGLQTALINPFDSLYTPFAYSQDLAVLLQKLNITRAWLVGHSLGGTIGLWTASQIPDIVKGVICVNAGGGIYLREAFEQFRSAGQKFLQMRPRWLSQLPLIDLFFTRNSVARPLERQWGRQRVIDFVTADPEAALGTLLDSTTEDEVNRLPQVVSELQQPVYFLAGADDKVMEPKYVRHLASFHPLFQYSGDNVIEIPNCGHLAMLEQPDTVAKEIRKLVGSV